MPTMANNERMSSSTMSGANSDGANPCRKFSGFMKSTLRLVEPIDCIQSKPCIVLMPLDASAHSDFCMHYYIEFIHKPENEVHVCYVANDYLRKKKTSEDEGVSDNMSFCERMKKRFKRVDLGPSPGVLAELEQKDRAHCHVVKTKAREIFTTNQILYDFHRLTGDDPWTAIINFSEKIEATLIVMGSRGLGKLKRSIFGSVSDKILKNSTVPVLVVKQTIPHCSNVIYHGLPESLIH